MAMIEAAFVFHSTFLNCSRIFSKASFMSTTAWATGKSMFFEPIVFTSRFISWQRKSNFLAGEVSCAIALKRGNMGFQAGDFLIDAETDKLNGYFLEQPLFIVSLWKQCPRISLEADVLDCGFDFRNTFFLTVARSFSEALEFRKDVCLGSLPFPLAAKLSNSFKTLASSSAIGFQALSASKSLFVGKDAFKGSDMRPEWGLFFDSTLRWRSTR